MNFYGNRLQHKSRLIQFVRMCAAAFLSRFSVSCVHTHNSPFTFVPSKNVCTLGAILFGIFRDYSAFVEWRGMAAKEREWGRDGGETQPRQSERNNNSESQIATVIAKCECVFWSGKVTGATNVRY